MLLSSFVLSLWLLLGVEASYSDNQNDDGHLSRDRRFTMKYKYLWPGGIAPFVYEKSALPYQHEIERVMEHIEDQSCVRMPVWNADTIAKYNWNGKGHVTFFKGNGCFSGMGFSKAGVRTSCCTGEACLHELGHALGFNHEQADPGRLGWIDVNMQFIPQGEKYNYVAAVPSGSVYWNYSRPYDISTMMHYHPVQFTKGKPAYSMDFPELSVASQYFYHFKEMAEGYKCYAKPQCRGRDLGCTNDGYQTIQHGQCRCVCVPGLDPDNQCKTILRKVTRASWPKGEYSLLKPKTGCPTGGDFKEGKITEYGKTGNTRSQTYSFAGELLGTKIDLHFCSRTAKDDVFSDPEGAKFNWPMGTYCIFKSGGKCPTGFDPRSYSYSVNVHASQGAVPDLSKGSVTLCCQFRGFRKEPASFPTDKPFALIKYPTEKCQQVTGMRYSDEYFVIESAEKMTFDKSFSRWYKGYRHSFQVPLCYYRQIDMNCGGIITLGKSNPETVIEMSSQGRTDLECTWLVKGENSKGTFVLDFEEFNVKKDGKTCNDNDRVEVRYAMIGQNGINFCGSVDHSIRSITDKMMIRFFTMRDSVSSFKAKIKWVPFDDMCYDVSRRGAGYDGPVNYTRRFEPCLPWAEMTNCPHNSITSLKNDRTDQLEGNACRNPDNSFRPWCYTKKSSCTRNYCDVCGLEKPFDHVNYCDKLKAQGFCTRDNAQVLKYCAATCYNDLPTRTPVKKYSEITCGPPKIPSDGKMVTEARSSYKLGQAVFFKCRSSTDKVISHCMTSGQFSKVDSACRPCPTGYHLHKDICLAYKKDAKYYQHAVSICKQAGGTVATPRNQAEANVIQKLAGGKFVWIGITDKVTESKWVRGDGTAPDWTNWADGEPTNYQNGEDCAVMKDSTKWNDVPCGLYAHQFVCSVPSAVGDCKDADGEKCKHQIADRPSLCKDFPEYGAQHCTFSCGFCQDKKKITCPVIENLEPNVVAVSTNAPFVSVGESVTYACSRFKFKQGGDESRACMGDGNWSGLPLRCSDCPLGYKEVNDECHGLFVGETHTFPEAKKACEDIGGFVAMPKTKAESDVVAEVGLGFDVWIGATDKDKEDTFIWQDGSGVFWTDWSSGEPKEVGEDKDCVYMDEHRRWVNVGCEEKKLMTVCTIPLSDDDLCYDMLDGGVSYDGHVNYTRIFEPCVSWAEATHCPHHTFKKGDELDNLVGNACRNPDKSYRPWCYTDKDSCTRNFCDVCGNEQPKDKGENCKEFKEHGLCAKDAVRAVKECAATCLDYLPDKTTVEEFSEIHCGTPIPPSDGTVVGKTLIRYNVGDTVEYKCTKGAWSVYGRCMTSGQWSQTNYACPDCPLGFTEDGDRCFQAVSKKDTYPNAAAHCKKMGGYVGVPRSEAESFAFKRILNVGGMWIGVSDEKTEGKWILDDGSKPTWFNWNKVEPNGKRTENCVLMGGYNGWIDVPCTYFYPYVCAANKLENKICQDFLSADQCVRLLKENPAMCQDHPDYARVHCAKTCGVCSDDKNVKCPAVPSEKAVTSLLPSTQTSIKPGHYVKYECAKGTYQAKGDAVRACLPDGTLTGDPMTCEDCPAGYTLLDNTCIGVVEGSRLTFPQAQAECKKRGGFVAMPKSVAENEVIAKMGDRHYFWIGLTDAETENTFVWEDGTPLNWENWADGSPQEQGESKDCVAMNKFRQWANIECQALKLKTICTIPLEGRKSSEASYNGAFYKLVDDLLTSTYANAVKSCMKLGGEVATPKSMDESRFIAKVAKGKSVWLGVTDKAVEGTWADQDGVRVKYTHWEFNEPNDFGIDGEDCAVMNPGLKWNDIACSYYEAVVCTIRHLESNLDCDKPTTTTQGDYVGNLKPKYNVGDTVPFKCELGGRTVLSRCMANHHWDDPALACLDCPGTYFNGYCYTYVNKSLPYADAEAYCNKEGGWVSAARSPQEAVMINKISPLNHTMTWVGITDTDKEGTWAYSNGDLVLFKNWRANEPNNIGPDGENCAGRFDGWLDVPCKYDYTFLCVKKLDIPV